jgi:hypothetical protein
LNSRIVLADGNVFLWKRLCVGGVIFVDDAATTVNGALPATPYV